MGNRWCRYQNGDDKDGYSGIQGKNTSGDKVLTNSFCKHVKFEDENIKENEDELKKEVEYVPENTDTFHYISAFEDSKKMLCAVDSSVKILETQTGKLVNELLHPQCVNQWWSFCEDQKVITWWQDGVVRIFYSFEDDISEQLATQFIGHRFSVTSGCNSLDENRIATGSRDTETILWDVEAQRKISNVKIDRNIVTDMVWVTTNNHLFLQCSEDLKLRLFDTRTKLQVVSNFKIGENLSNSMDIDSSGNYLTTGHQGFNGNFWHVKLWDLRKITEESFEPVFVFDHSQAVISTRFYYIPSRADQQKFILSASLDHTLRLTQMDGTWMSTFIWEESYTAMSPLRKKIMSDRLSVDTDKLIAAGTLKPQLQIYEVDEETLGIHT